MKRKPLLIIVLIVVLAGVAFYLYKTNTGKKLTDAEWREFAVTDTAAITKIFLADKAGNKVLVERKGKEWMVNNKFSARPDVMRYLLETIHSVRTKTKVPKNSKPFVLKGLSSHGIKVEVYTKDDDDPVKVYYVGKETPDQLGTYMMQEGSPDPFITEIQGFSGYLTPRYPAQEDVWKDHKMFRYQPDDIAKVKVNYVEEPANSFELTNNGNYSFTIKNGAGQALANVDKVMAQKYLGAFGGLVYEGEENKLKPAEVTALLATVPYATMQITDTKGVTTTISCYHIANTSGDVGADGKPILYNQDRFYMRVNTENKLYISQFYVWDRVLVPANFFAKE